MLTEQEGELAVKLARKAIEESLRSGKKIKPENLPPVYREKRGVFVTLNRITEKKELRGCIGRPYPIMSLGEAIITSAINAALEDTRFDPVRKEEIDGIVIEVSVLTVPKLIKEKPLKIPEKIVIGRDGLIVATDRFQGLLLPQVAAEYGWNRETFLRQTCLKAGLAPDAWQRGARIQVFTVDHFSDETPVEAAPDSPDHSRNARE